MRDVWTVHGRDRKAKLEIAALRRSAHTNKDTWSKREVAGLILTETERDEIKRQREGTCAGGSCQAQRARTARADACLELKTKTNKKLVNSNEIIISDIFWINYYLRRLRPKRHLPVRKRRLAASNCKTKLRK